jgi:Ricin-type beta-trefoil lectin domain-like
VPLGDGQITIEGSNQILTGWTRLGDISHLGLGKQVEGPILNRASGDYLEVANASTTDGASVSEFPGNGCDCQKWRFADAGAGYYIVNVKSGKVLEVQNSYVRFWD